MFVFHIVEITNVSDLPFALFSAFSGRWPYRAIFKIDIFLFYTKRKGLLYKLPRSTAQFNLEQNPNHHLRKLSRTAYSSGSSW
jgi:hypothetical protein